MEMTVPQRHASLNALISRIVLPLLLLCIGRAVCADTTTDAVLSEPVHECGDSGYHEFLQKNPVLFEAGQVHPLELSVDGAWLFALNSPAGCVEIYRVEDNVLTLASSVAVGLQPVSVRARNSHEIWVVNHLSDNVSVIELTGRPRVTQVLQVGDAPFDVVFAAPDGNRTMTRAYLSCAASGQHHPTFERHHLISNVVEYRDKTGRIRHEKLGMADVWVYDIRTGIVLNGIINPFMSGIRSLAVSADGSMVYGAGFLSGNQTAAIPVTPANTGPTADGVYSVAAAMIVKKKNGRWLDAGGKDVSEQVQIDLPDIDVIAIDAMQAPLPFNTLGGKPVTQTNRQLIKKTYSGAGSVLFSLAVDGDQLILTGLESHNDIVLEENLRGKATSNRLLMLRNGEQRVVDLDAIAVEGAGVGKAAYSLPLPGAIHVGKEYRYIAGFGSSRVGVFRKTANAGDLESVGYIELRDPVRVDSVAGLGPAGIVELPSGAVVILSRLDNALHVFSRSNIAQSPFFSRLQTISMYTPEPDTVVQGRRFLYDADKAGNGKVACASCHVFGDTDGLAWDLGVVSGKLVRNDKPYIDVPGAMIQNMANTVRYLPLKLSPDLYKVGDMVPVGRYRLPLCFKGPADTLHLKLQQKAFGTEPCVLYVTEAATQEESKDYHTWIMGAGQQWASVNVPYFHPLKGPMGTQTLFGLAYGGAMHHQGDRTGDEPAPGNHCPAGATLEERAFKEFNQSCDSGASSFEHLLGGHPLSSGEMDAFAGFALQMHFPPNPHRPLDNHLPDRWLHLFAGENIAKDITSRQKGLAPGAVGIAACSHCHRLDAKKGHFGGADGKYYSAPHAVTQDMDVPDFRAFYRKLGLYAVDYRNYFEGRPDSPYMRGNEQVSGYGFFHNAAFDAVNAVFNPLFFRYPGDQPDPGNGMKMNHDVAGRQNMFYFLSSFDTDVYPVAGQQRLNASAGEDIHELLNEEHCRPYGFIQGKFHAGGSVAGSAGAIITCYPVLQAGSATP